MGGALSSRDVPPSLVTQPQESQGSLGAPEAAPSPSVPVPGGRFPPGSRLGGDGWGCWWVAGRRAGLEGTTMDVSPSICPHYHVNGGREGEEGHVAARETPHMLPSGLACVPPTAPALFEGVKPVPAPPPAPNSGEERYHPLFRALKRLQGPALLTRGDAVPGPASPVCPSHRGLLPWLARWVPGSGKGGGGAVRTQGVGAEHPESISCLWGTAPLSGAGRR